MTGEQAKCLRMPPHLQRLLMPTHTNEFRTQDETQCNKCRRRRGNNGINLWQWALITLPVSMEWLWRVIKLSRTNHPDSCWMHRAAAISTVQANHSRLQFLNAIVLSHFYRAKSALSKTKHSLNLIKRHKARATSPPKRKSVIFVCGVSDASSLILVHHPGFCVFEATLSNLCVCTISMTTGPMPRI